MARAFGLDPRTSLQQSRPLPHYPDARRERRQTAVMTLMPNPVPEDARALAEVVKVLLTSVGGGLGFAAAGPFGAALAAGGAQGANGVIDVLRDRWLSRSSVNADRAIRGAIDMT